MPETDLELLADAAREAGEIALKYWRDDPQVWDKGGDDPVSEADYAVDTHLHQRLLGARPGYGWVSEETEDNPDRLQAEHVFIVDPIDGTRSFVAGQETWAHSLALAVNGEIAAACVYLPARDKLYLAGRGAGATLNGVSLQASRTQDLNGASVLGPKVSFQEEFWRRGPPPVERHFRPSLAYRMALVGEGRFDAMLTFRPAWEWDIAAGTLIAEEAGARVTDRHGQTLRFNSPARQTAGVIAGGPAIHAAISAELA